jgi:outer membrane protein assembly factor BamB
MRSCRSIPSSIFSLLLILLASGGTERVIRGAEWAQDAGNAQRTGFTPEEPALPWRFAWTWNGPDEKGGTGAHHYHQPRPHEPWEARICTGGSHVFAPAGKLGLYALNKTDGIVAWQFQGATCNATPAYDATSQSVIVGTDEGDLFRLEAATGKVLGHFAAGSPLTKPMLVAVDHAFALTSTGILHKVALGSMADVWRYEANSAAQTSPALSEARGVVVFGTADLRVHAIGTSDGKARWSVKPTPAVPADGAEFTGGWPVVAERHGIVFVRLGFADINTVLWSGGDPKGKWPGSNAAIRERLRAEPKRQTLFALRLDDGTPAFVPAVGPSGVEDLHEGKPRLRPHSFPVIKPIGEGEVAYMHWRNGDTRDPKWDARWDSHLGEMNLDERPDLAAGDLRFVQFEEQDGWARITDESCPLSMAGDTLFYAHWDVSQSARVVDRSPTLGLTRTVPIRTEARPPVARHLRLPAGRIDPASHWIEGGMTLVDGRTLRGPGWWVYANELDPPTPARDAYSEGILPRYTCVADGLIIVQGNGGDLFVLRHSGTKK